MNTTDTAIRTVGEQFALALAAKDREALLALFADPLDFQGLTPGRHWQAQERRALVDDILLGSWFEPTDHIERLLAVTTGAVADRQHVAYRLAVRNADGDFVVEQQAYFVAQDATISWMRVLCSGFRPS